MPSAKRKKVDKMIEALYERLCADPTLMPNFYMQVAYHQGMDRAVADYISGMSDELLPACLRSCLCRKVAGAIKLAVC